jgi:hypothetical protein
MNFAPFAGPWKLDTPSGAPYLRAIQPRVEWREDKVRMGMVLARERVVGIQPGFIPEPRHRLEAYATLTPPRGSGGRAELPSGSISTNRSTLRRAM